eukprot:CAMPEP_0194378820 /NCGR_PEP_ID=MMETSP0174-20130528/37113_1 /TAXON_ID=216777 /ORGANISM="Proboscia alata, Strain PI-D3" /LENGTH=74 /DNA_ID=CAMNT_0039161105 /DNA_START=48 /DNA_END=272 /DNA_ORIENTATION=-
MPSGSRTPPRTKGYNRSNKPQPATNDYLAQIVMENNHKSFTEANKNALVSDMLDKLRSLTEEIEEDNWKFSPDR